MVRTYRAFPSSWIQRWSRPARHLSHPASGVEVRLRSNGIGPGKRGVEVGIRVLVPLGIRPGAAAPYRFLGVKAGHGRGAVAGVGPDEEAGLTDPGPIPDSTRT